MKSTQLSLLFVLVVCKGINDGVCQLDQRTQSLRNDVKNQLTNLWDAMTIYHSVFTLQPSSKALTSCCQTTSHTPHLDLFFTFGQHMRDLLRSSIVNVIKLVTNPSEHLTQCDYTPGNSEGLTPQEQPPVPTPDLPSAPLPYDAPMPPYTMTVHGVPQAGGYAAEKYEEPRRKKGIISSKSKLRYRHKVCRPRSRRASSTTDMVHIIDTTDNNSTAWLASGVALGFLITVVIHLTYRVSYESHYKQMKALRKNMMAVLATGQPYSKRYQHRCGRRCRGKDVAECHKAWMALNRNSFMRTRSEEHKQSSLDHEGGSYDQTNAPRTREQFQVEETQESQTTSIDTDRTQISCGKRTDILDSAKASWSNMSDTLYRPQTTCSNKTEPQDSPPTPWSDEAGTLERTQTYWNNEADMHDGTRTDTPNEVETADKAEPPWSDEDEMLVEIPVLWSQDAHLFEETQASWSSDSEGLTRSTSSENLARTHAPWSSEDSTSDSNVKSENTGESSAKSRGSRRRKRFRSSRVHSDHHTKSRLVSEDSWLACRSGMESVRSSANSQPYADYDWTHFPNSDVGLPQVLPWDNDDAYSEAHSVHKTSSSTPSSHSSLGEEMRGPWVSTSLSFIVYDLDIINDIPNEVLEVLSCDKSLCEKHPHNRYHYLGRKVIVQRLPALDVTPDQQTCDKTTSTSFIPELPMSAIWPSSSRLGVVCTHTQTLNTSITIQTQTSPSKTSSDVHAKETVKSPISRIPTSIIRHTKLSAANSREPSPKAQFGLRQPDQSTANVSPKVQIVLRHPDPSSANSREPSPKVQSVLRHPDQSSVSSRAPSPKVQSGLRRPNQSNLESPPRVQARSLRTEQKAAKSRESSPKVQASSLRTEQKAAKSRESSPKVQTSSLRTEQNAAKIRESSPKVQTSSLRTELNAAKSRESSPKVQTSSLGTEQNAAKSRESSPKVHTSLLHTKTCTVKSQEPSLHSPTRFRHNNLVMDKRSPSKQYSPGDFVSSEVQTRPFASLVHNIPNAVKSRNTSQESRSSCYNRGTVSGASRSISTTSERRQNAESDKAMRQTRGFISSASSASSHHEGKRGDNKTKTRICKAEMSHLSANTSRIPRPVKVINDFKETDNKVYNITKWWSEKSLISDRDPARVSSSNSSELDRILHENMTEAITPLTEAQIVASEFFDVDFDEDAKSLSRTSIITGNMCQLSTTSSFLEKKQNVQSGNKSTFELSPHSEYPRDSEIQESKQSKHVNKITPSLSSVISVGDTAIAKHDNQCFKDILSSSAPAPSKESTGWRDVSGSGLSKIKICMPAVMAAAADFVRDERLDFVVPDESLQARNSQLPHTKESTTVTDHGHEQPLHNWKDTSTVDTLQFKSIKEKDLNADAIQESEKEEVSKIMLTTSDQKKPKTDSGQPNEKNNESKRLNARSKFLSIRNAFEQRISPSSKEPPLTKKRNVSPSQNQEESDKIESESNQFEFVPIFSFSFNKDSKPPDESTFSDGEKQNPSTSPNEQKQERNLKGSAEDMSAEIKVPQSPEAPKKEPYQSLSKASNKDISPPWEVSSRAKNAVFSPIGWIHPKPEISSILRVQSRDSMEEVSEGTSSTYMHKNDGSQINQASSQASTRHSEAKTYTVSKTSLSCTSNAECCDESRQSTCTSTHEPISEFQAGQDTREQIALKQVRSSSVDFQDSSDTDVTTLVPAKCTTVSFGTEQTQSHKSQYDYSTIATGISESISELKAVSTSWLSNTIQALNPNPTWPISSETSFARNTQFHQSESVWRQIPRIASNNVPGVSTQTLQESSTSTAVGTEIIQSTRNVADETKTSIPALQRPKRLKRTLRKLDFTKTSLSSAKSRGCSSTLIPVPKAKSRLPVACATSENSHHSSSSSTSSSTYKTASAGTLNISLKTFPPNVKAIVDRSNRQVHGKVSTNHSSTDVQLPSKTIQSRATNEQIDHSRTNTVRDQRDNGHDCSSTCAILNKNSEIIEKIKLCFTQKESHTNPQSIIQQSINGVRNLIFKKDTQVQEQEERDNEDLRSSHAFPVHVHAPKSDIVQSEDRQLNKDQKHNNQTCRDLLGNDIFEDNKNMVQTGGINITTGSDILVETFVEALTASSFSQRSKNTPFAKRESPVDKIFAKRESPVDTTSAKRESPVDANAEEAKLIQSRNSLQENLSKNSQNPPKIETSSQLSISQNVTTSSTAVFSSPERVCNIKSKRLSPLIARKIKKLENSMLMKKASVQRDQKPIGKIYSYLNESAALANNSLSENTLNEQSVPANKTRAPALTQPSKLPHLVKNTSCIVQSQADCVRKAPVRRLIVCNANAKDNISQNHSSNTSPPVFCMEDQFFSPEPSFVLWSEVGNLCHQAIRQTDDNGIFYNCNEEVGCSSCNVSVSQMTCLSSDSDSSIVSDEEASYKRESEAECQSTNVNASNILYLHSDSNPSIISVSVKDAVDNCENEAECSSANANASNILYLHFDSDAPVILDKDIMFNCVRDTEHTFCNANTRNIEYGSSDSETSLLSDGIHTEPCTSFSTITEEISFFACHYSGQIFPSNIVRWKESNVHRNVVSNFHENRISVFDCKSNNHGIIVTDYIECHIQDSRNHFVTNDDDKEYFTPIGCDSDTTTDFDQMRLSSLYTNNDETTDFGKDNLTLFSSDEDVATNVDEERLTALKYRGNKACDVDNCSFTPLVCTSNITNDFGKDNFSTLIFTLLSCDNNITSDLDKGYFSTLSFNGNMKSETDKEIFTQFTRSNHMRYNTKTPFNAKSLISFQQQPHLSCCKPTDDCVSSNIVIVNMDLICCSMSERSERKSCKKCLEQKSDSFIFHLGKLHLHSNHLDNTVQKYIPLDNDAMVVSDFYSAPHKLCRLMQINTIDSGDIYYSHTCEQFTTGTGATDLMGKPLFCAQCIMLSKDVIYTLSTLDGNIDVPIEGNEDVLSPICSHILLPSSSLSGILEYYRASKTGAEDFGRNLFQQSYLGGSAADPSVKERNIDLILSPSDLWDSNVHFLYNNLRQDKNIGILDRARLELTCIWNVDRFRMKTKTGGARGRLDFTNLWKDNALPSKLDGFGALWNVNITHNPALNLPAILNFQIPPSRPQGVSTVLSVPLSLPSIDYRTYVKEDITSINRPLLMPGHNRVVLRMCRNVRTADKLCCIFKSLTHCVVYTIR